MADTGNEIHETPANDRPPVFPSPFPAPTYPPAYPSSSFPFPSAPPPARTLGLLERWRTPLLVALVTVFLVFGVLDVSSVFLRPAQNSGTTRPLIINAQVMSNPTPPAHPDLGLAPDALSIACGKSGNVIVTNRSARPLQWSATLESDALSFTTDTPRSGLLAPGHSIALHVLAFSQPGPYLLHFTDDHGEQADVPVQISC
ncbi:MAG TPA: hypothetical protein VKQ30_21460 [Ktedonobacterales bacterium]|nr:hypothetical protein [Ktedonobacterales bacterium]